MVLQDIIVLLKSLKEMSLLYCYPHLCLQVLSNQWIFALWSNSPLWPSEVSAKADGLEWTRPWPCSLLHLLCFEELLTDGMHSVNVS